MTTPPSTAPICPECVAPDEDPLPWCECADSTDTCTGPCRQRAHNPDRCPVGPGHLALVADLRAKIKEQARTMTEVAVTVTEATATIRDQERRLTSAGATIARLEGQLAEVAADTGTGPDASDTAHDDCWVPVTLRWHHVVAGDVIVTAGADPKLWGITTLVDASEAANVITVDAVRGAEKFTKAVDPTDPKATVRVLERHSQREALVTCRESLGARVVGRSQ